MAYFHVWTKDAAFQQGSENRFFERQNPQVDSLMT